MISTIRQTLVARWSHWRTAFQGMMFELGYLFMALTNGVYCYSQAVFRYFRSKDKSVDDDVTEALLEKGDISIELFLNRIKKLRPTKHGWSNPIYEGGVG